MAIPYITIIFNWWDDKLCSQFSHGLHRFHKVICSERNVLDSHTAEKMKRSVKPEISNAKNNIKDLTDDFLEII